MSRDADSEGLPMPKNEEEQKEMEDKIAQIPKYLRKITDGFYEETNLKDIFLRKISMKQKKKNLSRQKQKQPDNELRKETFSKA